ncbi:erythromycin esterase family protein [Streptomyces sp. NPDC057137]|uniref:erythromycin esterase family protein n=1 Tax=Streptomyces sp. NPDC057137 TaxID=3346030 RepID=UPI00362C233E
MSANDRETRSGGMGESGESGEVTGWLSRNSVPLSGGLTAGAPTADLQPLKEVLDGVRIVGLGESTHGTHEFFRLKHRLLEYLVTELGFTTLAMEASASAGPAVDAYVRSGVGDPAQVLTGLGFWTWRTEEVLDMIEWMRAYNDGRPANEQVRFAGIDPQRSGDSLAVLEAFLTSVAPDRLPALHSTLGILANAYPGSRPDPRQGLMHEAEKLLEYVRGYENIPAGAVAVRHARILVRAADLVTRSGQHPDPERTVSAARDRYMAEAVEEILDGDPAAKVVLWGHNSHIAKGRTADDAVPPPLGRHLRERYGDAYYALGLLFGEGSFRAHRIWPGPWSGVGGLTGRIAEGNPIGPAPATTVEAQLATATPADHLLDLRPAGADDAPRAVREWVAAPHTTRSFGALVPRWFYRRDVTPVRLSEEYDGLAYVAVSSDSRPIAPYRPVRP